MAVAARGQLRGAVPTHGDGGGTIVGGPDDGKYIDADEMAIHGRAHKIASTDWTGKTTYARGLEKAREETIHRRALEIFNAAHGRITEVEALKQARAEAAQKAAQKTETAKKRVLRFGEVRFSEGGRLPVDPLSTVLARRADSILSENGWPSGRYGDALKIARREAAEGE
jgi:hypothetical protein